MTEQQWQRRVTDLCDWLALRWHHETDSRRSKAGFPDLVIVGNTVVYAELKVGRGRLTREQTEWATDLATAGAEVHTWYPDQWNDVQHRLKRLAFDSVPTGSPT